MGGGDLAADDLEALESCHRLLSSTYCRFCASYGNAGSRRSEALLATALRVATYDFLFMALGDESRTAAEEDAQPAAPAEECNAWSAEKSARRSKGLQYCLGNPFGVLMLTRCVMEAPRQYIGQQFARAGKAWERKQQGKVAAAMAEGKPLVGSRKYRPAVVAEGSDDAFDVGGGDDCARGQDQDVAVQRIRRF